MSESYRYWQCTRCTREKPIIGTGIFGLGDRTRCMRDGMRGATTMGK